MKINSRGTYLAWDNKTIRGMLFHLFTQKKRVIKRCHQRYWSVFLSQTGAVALKWDGARMLYKSTVGFCAAWTEETEKSVCCVPFRSDFRKPTTTRMHLASKVTPRPLGTRRNYYSVYWKGTSHPSSAHIPGAKRCCVQGSPRAAAHLLDQYTDCQEV